VDGQSHETEYKKKLTTEIRQSKRKEEERRAVFWALGTIC